MGYEDLTFEDLGKGYKICISTEHRFGTDAFLLADFTRPRHKDKVCDFCTGCGIIALIMRRNFQPKKLYALEVQQKAFEQLRLSIEKSGAGGDTFAVLGSTIIIQQLLKRLLNHFFLFIYLLIIHN